jgi:hypothetical protein
MARARDRPRKGGINPRKGGINKLGVRYYRTPKAWLDEVTKEVK